MKFRLRPLAALVGLLALGVTVLSAQDNRPTATQQSQGSMVAVIDIARILKENVRFKAHKEELSKDMKAFEDFVNQQKTDIVKKREQLKEYKQGSSEYQRIEGEMTRQVTNLQVKVGLKRNEILTREAKLLYDTYMEVTNHVTQIANQHGIALVLRYNSEKIDPDNRENVQRGINNSIVFQRNRDITELVLRAMNTPRNARRP